MIWKLPQREIHFPRRPLVMGIVNVNDDSFSGDGTLDAADALQMAREQIEAGADVIDFGAESARTNRKAISVEEEVCRLRPVLDSWSSLVADAKPRDDQQVWPPVLSVNTWRSGVVGEVLPLGVELINDMSGLPDIRNAELCAQHEASLLIMHSVGEPKVPHLHQQWDDVVSSMTTFFAEKMGSAVKAGLSKEQIVLDPGIDFAKQRDDNLAVYRQLDQIVQLGCPVLVPVSRKTVVGEVLGIEDPVDRDAGSVACIVASVRAGAHLFRVHNVEAAWQSLKVLDALRP